MCVFFRCSNGMFTILLQSLIVDYIVFLKFKEWLKTKMSSATPYDKIYNETRNTNWLPTSTSSAALVVGNNLGAASPKNRVVALETKNGFVNFSSSRTEDNNGTSHQSAKTSGDASPCKTSPSESGICVASPASQTLSPGEVSVDVPLDDESGHQEVEPGQLFKSIAAIPLNDNNFTKGDAQNVTSFSSPNKSCNSSDFYLNSSQL